MSEIGPLFKGQTGPPWAVEIVKSDNEVLDITGATFEGALVNMDSNTVKTLTAGNYVIDDAANGKFSYSPDAGDVDEVGLWEFRTELTVGGAKYMTLLTIEILPWRIT